MSLAKIKLYKHVNASSGLNPESTSINIIHGERLAIDKFVFYRNSL